MGRRKQFFRAGLLITILTLFTGGFLFSQDGGASAGPGAGEEEPDPVLEILVETSPANPIVNNPWTLVIMVDHPNPSQVNVRPPELPSFVHQDRIRIEARTFREERWTRAEYIFTSQRAGTVTFEPFLVTVQGRQAETSRFNVNFREAPVVVRSYNPRFRWLGSVPSIHSGLRGELILELTDWNPDLPVPRGIYQGRSPLNAIISESPPAAAGSGVYQYTISVIALEEGTINLAALSFRSATHNLSVPALNIPVLPPLPAPEDAEETGGPLEVNPSQALVFPFPENPGRVFSLLQGSYDRAAARARALWDEGRRAEALGEIRRNERDSLAGPFFSPLRREMEQVLGLGYTENEKWRPLKVHPVSWVVSFLLLLLTAVFLLFFRPRRGLKIRNVISGRFGGLKAVVILIFAMGLAYIFVEEGLRKLPQLRINPLSNAVVMERIPAYRIPDSSASVNSFFAEGQPVTVGDFMGEWRYAESPDGRSGWVSREAIITY